MVSEVPGTKVSTGFRIFWVLEEIFANLWTLLVNFCQFSPIFWPKMVRFQISFGIFWKTLKYTTGPKMGSFGPFLGILWPFKDYFLSMTWSLPTTIAPKVQKVAICSFNMSCRRCLSFCENLFHGDSLSGSKDISPRSWPKNAFSQKNCFHIGNKVTWHLFWP